MHQYLIPHVQKTTCDLWHLFGTFCLQSYFWPKPYLLSSLIYYFSGSCQEIYIYIHFISNWCVSGIHVKAHPHTHIHACPDTFQTKRLLFNIHDQKGSGLGQDFYWPETRNLLQNDLPWKCSCVVRDETFLKDNFIMSLLHNGYNLLWSPLQ